jgi:hypothetical protein
MNLSKMPPLHQAFLAAFMQLGGEISPTGCMVCSGHQGMLYVNTAKGLKPTYITAQGTACLYRNEKDAALWLVEYIKAVLEYRIGLDENEKDELPIPELASFVFIPYEAEVEYALDDMADAALVLASAMAK